MEWNLSDYEFLHLPQSTSVCVCCLAKDVQLICLKTCVHSSLLTLSFGNMLKNELVCLRCHRELQKFHTFRLHIEENIRFLTHQTVNIECHTKEIHSLQKSNIDIYNTPIPNNPVKDNQIEIFTYKDEIISEIVRTTDDLGNQKRDKLERQRKRQRSDLKRENDESENLDFKIKQELSGSERENDHIYTDIPDYNFKQEEKELFNSHQDLKPLEIKDNQKSKKLRKRKKNKEDYENANILPVIFEKAETSVTHSIPVENLRYTCDYCGRMFQWRCTLKRHLAAAHVNHRLECRHCAKVFKNDLALRRHVRSLHERKDQTNEAPVQCPICKNIFKMKKTLHVHLKKIHRPDTGKEEERYCVECNKQFKSKAMYELHLKTTLKHAANKYECHDCGRKFTVKGNLMEHIQRTHLKRLNHACSFCGKLFYKRYKRREHEQYNHFGVPKQRNHMCNSCGKAFTTYAVLKRHMLIHSGVKIQCEYCPSKFSQTSTLRTHIKFKHKDALLQK